MSAHATEDVSTFVIAGQVVPAPRAAEHESTYRTPAQGIDDAVEAERLGFRRVFLSERWNIKEAGALLGGMAARTSRVDIGSGVISPCTRHPQQLAAFGATMHAAYGPRCILGLGLGSSAYFAGLGITASSYPALTDYVRIMRRLWKGETVTYDGPAGRYPALTLGFPYEGRQPEVWFGTFANPKGAAAAASVMDGVLLPPMLTPDATSAAVARLRQACEQIDRDPATLRIAQCVVTAPDLDDFETRALAHSRAVTYLKLEGYNRVLAAVNSWDWSVVEAILEDRTLSGVDASVDWKYHRVDLMEPAARVPDAWMRNSCALGTQRECLDALRAFRDAGADELTLYGSTPAQNGGLLTQWRERAAVRS